MKSNSKNPVAFFEFILEESNLLFELNRKLEYSDYASYQINLPDTIDYVIEDDKGNLIKKSTTIQSILIPLLKTEYENSKTLILETYLQNTEITNKNFLTILFNSLQSLIFNKSEFINDYPYFLFPIRGLVKYINDKFLLSEMGSFNLDENLITSIPVNEYYNIETRNDQIIHSVISYMNGKNEKQEQILNQSDYDLLLSYTTHLVATGELPTITKQLRPKISNDQIRFSFYVLHKELYTTKSINSFYYKFIKEVFSNFDNSEISSIKSIFGTKRRVTKDKFLPEIILKHLK